MGEVGFSPHVIYPAGTRAEGSPSRLAGATGRIGSLVAAVQAGVPPG
jgi:hypothetical protein